MSAPKMLYREMEVDASAMTLEEREIAIAFSSEMPVARTDYTTGKTYMEVLDHGNGNADLSRLNAGGAFLVNHNPDDQAGAFKRGSVSVGPDCIGRGVVKLSRSERGTEILGDMKDGIRSLVSFGYQTTKLLKSETIDGVETRRFAFKAFEASTVPIPADETVGVGRNASETEKQPTAEVSLTTKTYMETPSMPVIDEAKIRAEAGNSQLKRVNEILEVGRKFNAVEAAQAFIREGKSTEDFYRHITETQLAAKPINTSSEIGMSVAEVRDYSLIKAIRAHVTGNWKDAGLERAASEAMAKLTGRDTSGFFIPSEVSSKRDLTATTNSTGKYSVQTNVLGGSLIELLRNMTVTKELGARTLSGLQGNIAIPSQSGGATAYWVAENGQTTASNLTFGQVALSPHRLSAVSAISKQLLAQSSVDVESLVREDFARILAIELDRAALAGDGSGSSPVGILSTSGIGTTTFTTAATYAKIVDLETQVANANALRGNPAYVTTPNTRAKLKAAAKIGSTFPSFIWENNQVNGYQAMATLQVPTNRVIFGNFNDLIIADWIGMDVTVDPYSLADKNQIKITVNMLADIGVRNAGSFAASTDSGAA